MPYLEPKMDEGEREALLKLIMDYAESDPNKSGEVFLKILTFIDGLMLDVYHFGRRGNDFKRQKV